jgi:hypothetical protein
MILSAEVQKCKSAKVKKGMSISLSEFMSLLLHYGTFALLLYRKHGTDIKDK